MSKEEIEKAVGGLIEQRPEDVDFGFQPEERFKPILSALDATLRLLSPLDHEDATEGEQVFFDRRAELEVEIDELSFVDEPTADRLSSIYMMSETHLSRAEAAFKRLRNQILLEIERLKREQGGG